MTGWMRCVPENNPPVEEDVAVCDNIAGLLVGGWRLWRGRLLGGWAPVRSPLHLTVRTGSRARAARPDTRRAAAGCAGR